MHKNILYNKNKLITYTRFNKFKKFIIERRYNFVGQAYLK